MPCQGAAGQGLPRAWNERFPDVMPLRYLVAPLAVLMLLAGATAFAGPSDSAVHSQITVNDSAAAVQLAQGLPRSLLFSDRMGTAQVANLSEPLQGRAGHTISSYRAGDVAYWHREQSIIVFLTDGAGVPADGLSLIGHISDGLDELAGCHRNCLVILDYSMDRSAGREETDG